MRRQEHLSRRKVDPGRLSKVGERKLADALGKVDAIIDLVSEGRF